MPFWYFIFFLLFSISFTHLALFSTFSVRSSFSVFRSYFLLLWDFLCETNALEHRTHSCCCYSVCCCCFFFHFIYLLNVFKFVHSSSTSFSRSSSLFLSVYFSSPFSLFLFLSLMFIWLKYIFIVQHNRMYMTHKKIDYLCHFDHSHRTELYKSGVNDHSYSIYIINLSF